MSILRALVITTVYGRGGLSRSAETVHEDELPAETDAQQVEQCVVPLLAGLISGHRAHFIARSALTAPAVLAGLGIAVHHTTPWADPSNALAADQLSRLLSDMTCSSGLPPVAFPLPSHHRDVEHTHEPATARRAPVPGTARWTPRSDRPAHHAVGSASARGPAPRITVTKEVKVPGPEVTVTKTATVTAEPPKPPKPKGPPTTVGGDGEYLVGEEMRAGTYRTGGPGDSFGCYWERARNSSGEFDAIIANGNLEGSGRVTVNKGEVFTSTGCQDWKKAG